MGAVKTGFLDYRAEAFKRVRTAFEDAYEAHQSAVEWLKEVLPVGSCVEFQFGNMRDPAPAVVRHVFQHWGPPRLQVENLFTHKLRDIPLDAIVLVGGSPYLVDVCASDDEARD
jgi:hypothetical protein